MGKVGAGAAVIYFDDSAIEQIDAPIGAEEGDIAFEIQGESMLPLFLEGGIIVVRPVVDVDEVLRKRAVVKLKDGRRYFKTVIEGSRPGLFNLLSHNSEPILNVAIESAARFKAYVEP